MAIGSILVLHAALALATGLAGRRLGRSVLLLAALGPAAALGYTAAVTPTVLAGNVPTVTIDWASGLGLALDLRLDGFGLLFWWVIAGIGLLVMLYANRYFSPRRDLGRFTSMLVLFAGAMLLLTAADNVFLLFVAWELTSITSYLLIGFEDQKATARGAALQALLVTGMGGLALLGGLVLLGQAAGTYSLSGILDVAPGSGLAQAGLALVLLGAATKSAQTPFHFWLPGAMAAPTPVSAYLHSATMVKAGLYLVARVAPDFAPVAGWWTPAVVVVGGASLLVGGWRALRATDLKALLAYGTISQLGFMMVLLGFGDPELTHAGVAVLLAHALLKATLFLTVGVVDHQAHERDLRRLTGLGSRMPLTGVSAGVAAASMAGVIPLLGFVAKETALEASLHAGGGLVTTVIVVGAILTTAYGLRFLWGAFGRKKPANLVDDPITADEVERPSLAFELPAVILAVATFVFGVWVAPADTLVRGAATALDPGAAPFYLVLWHGLGAALYLSVLPLALGAALFLLPGLVERASRLTTRVPDTTDLYRRSLFGLNRLADRTTTIAQPGSLPIYLGVILATTVILPGIFVASGFQLPADLVLADSPLQAAVAAGVVGAALGTAFARRRLAAVILLGGVGFGMAVLFVIQGAPDLALTQLLIETLALGLFVLVLRRLPKRFEQPSWFPGRALRVVLSVSVGLLVGTFALFAASARH
ncbi:MAG: proton-conducting transporter membrane subunit, partial [Nitriliruptorales bacterium]|nr:proton-conducting transporter membrane subunit [Nitriliruptorales bacterium]